MAQHQLDGAPYLPLNRKLLVRCLRYHVSRLHLTGLILRLAEFIILSTLAIAYATSDPGIQYEVLVWPIDSNAAIPSLDVTIHPLRKTYIPPENEDWGTQALPEPFHWTRSTVSEDSLPGASSRYVCRDEHFDCDERRWAVDRLRWVPRSSKAQGDSRKERSVRFEDTWAKETIQFNEYTFWLLLIVFSLAMGHNLIVLVFSMEPSGGTTFFTYTAIVDLIFSVGFLFLGILPLRIQLEGDGAIPLDPSQSYAFALGWTAWGLYSTSFIVDVLLVSSLRRYVAKTGYHIDISTSSIAPYVDNAASTVVEATGPNPRLPGEHPLNDWEVRPGEGVVTTRATVSTGYAPSIPTEDSAVIGTVSRSMSSHYS